MDRFADTRSAAIVAYHDRALVGAAADIQEDNGAWRFIRANHRCNRLLWAEEDLARREHVPDCDIVASKRAIDRYNQERNDAIECIDDELLARLRSVIPREGAWHASESAGSIIDRLSILSLKLFHMKRQTLRGDASLDHIALCRKKVAQLQLQRRDLANCLDHLLSEAQAGRAFFRIYKQFKMYNDPAFHVAKLPERRARREDRRAAILARSSDETRRVGMADRRRAAATPSVPTHC
jgi:hypothetical protein